MKRGDQEHLQRIQALAQAFRPAAPIDRSTLFSGRTTQLADLFGVAEQPGQHAIVYGERGVGKTSLVMVATEMLAAAGDVVTARTTCDRSDDFSSVWWKVLDQIRVLVTTQGVGFSATASQTSHSAAGLLGGDATPYSVKRSIEAVAGEKRVVVLIDEFDRLGSDEARLLFADTIKTLSDQLPRATVVLVGVADTVEELIAEHQSIERAVVQIHMPRMSRDELERIVTHGMETAGLTIEPVAVGTIALLAQGLPHYAHLLGQISGRIALDDLRTKVRSADVDAAVAEAIEKTQQTVLEAYSQATAETRATLYPKVVLACALARGDEFGFFGASEVRTTLGEIAGKPYDTRAFNRHLDELAGPARGNLLQKRSGLGNARYRFGNPLLQPYVLMRGVAEGAVAPEVLREA